MKRWLPPMLALALGLIFGTAATRCNWSDGTISPRPFRPLATASERHASPVRSRREGLKSFLDERMPPPEGPPTAWLAKERKRLRENARSPFRTSAVIGTVIEDMSQEQLMELLVKRQFSSTKEFVRVFTKLAEIDPVQALEIRRKTRLSVEEMDQSIKAVFAVWVRRDAGTALQWCYHLPSSGERQASSLFLTEEWLKFDPQGVALNFERLQHARGFGQFAAGFEDQLLKAWVAKDLAAAEKWLATLPPGNKRDRLQAAFDRNARR